MTAPSLPRRAPKWSAILEVQDPDGTRTRHPFRHPRIAVGRRRDNDLSLADEGISHRHCEFVSEHGYFMVRDLGSQNGTWVNDRRVGAARLRDGDQVRIGGTRILVALEGSVRRPDRRRRWPAAGIALGLVAAGALWFWQAERQRGLRAAWAGAVREQVGADTCVAPQFAGLDAADASIGGRSFAVTVRRGELRLSAEDEKLDRELQALHQRKAALYAQAFSALQLAQEQRREAAERLSRAGRRLSSSRERKTADFVDALVQERLQAVDELALAVKQLSDDTDALTYMLASLLAGTSGGASADPLRRFRFRADLRAARAACEEKAASASAGLLGAVSALSD